MRLRTGRYKSKRATKWTNSIATVSHPLVLQNSPLLTLRPQKNATRSLRHHRQQESSATETALLATGDPHPLRRRRIRDTAIKLMVDTQEPTLPNEALRPHPRRKVRLATATDLATIAITHTAHNNGVQRRPHGVTAVRRESIPTNNMAARIPVAQGTNHRQSMHRQDRRSMSRRMLIISTTPVDTVRIRVRRRMGIRDPVRL